MREDTFVFDTLSDAISHVRIDAIADLSDLEDSIDVSAIDADQSTAGDQAFHLITHGHTQGAGGVGELQVRYHDHGIYAGLTTIKGWTNADHKIDVLILVSGDHGDFSSFGL
jgi:hypothetical protein